MKFRTHLTYLSALVLAAVPLVLTTSSTAAITPDTATFTLRAGTSDSEAKTVSVPTKPEKADIVIAIDTTGSMGSAIETAQTQANALVTGIQAEIPGARFAVIDFEDYPGMPLGGPGDTAYSLLTGFTANPATVSTAIGTMVADGGGDGPEASNRAIFESYSDPSLVYQSGAAKFLVVLGDALSHDAAQNADFSACPNTPPTDFGRDEAAGGGDDLGTKAVLDGLVANDITLFMIAYSGVLPCYEEMAALTGGDAVPSASAGDLTDTILDLIEASFATVADVHLEVASAAPAPASPAWISFVPSAAGPVNPPVNVPFTVNVAVPSGTPSGTYVFDIVALADGADIGHQLLTIVVPQKMLTLTPANESNPIGTSHTVTARAFDVLGPFVGETIGFTVTGTPSVPMSGSDTTDPLGEATFTFTNSPPAPGANVVTASWAAAALTATATKDWLNVPPSCEDVTLDITELWPPNHSLHWITATGATAGDIGDTVSLVITGVSQDEPVDGVGDGNTSPDAFLTSPASNRVQVRAERAGRGDGRVYVVSYTATDLFGGSCSGTATVSVPHDQSGAAAVNSAPPSYNSLLP